MSSRSPSRSKSRSRSNHRRRSDSASDRSKSRGRSYSRSRSPPKRGYGDRGYKRSDGPNAPSNCIGCFGMDPYTKESTIREAFEKFGEVEKVVIIQDKGTGLSRGYGFITFRHFDDAVEACEKMVGERIDNKEIRVDYSKTKRAHTPTPGQYYGRRTDRFEGRDNYDRRDRYRDRRDDGYRNRRDDYNRTDRYRREDKSPRRSRSSSRSKYSSRRSRSPRRTRRSRSPEYRRSRSPVRRSRRSPSPKRYR